MQAGELIGGDVQSFTSRVLVNGVERPHLAWSVDRDVVSDLPDQVSGGAGIAQATGSVEWGSTDVETGAVNPWNASVGWLPVEGDRVEIWAGDGVSEWRQFKGVIDSTSGSVGGGVTSKIVDRIDDLSAKVSLPALAAVMPPLTAAGAFRRFRLSPRWHVMMAARAGGFHATPAPEANSTLDVPAFGSMWPAIGEGITCAKGTNPDNAPEWPNGTHVADVSARCKPDAPRIPSRAVQLTMNIAAGHTGVASLTADYAGQTVTLRATFANVLLMVNGATVLNVPRTGAAVAVARFENGAARLRTSEGQDADGSTAWAATQPMTEARIVANPDALVNGFIISHPTQPAHDFANLGWEPTANIVTGTMHDALLATRGTNDQSARDMLEEIGSALLWPYWIDENGVLQAIQSDVLRGRGSAQTVTTLDDIRELDWERNLLSVRSLIDASYTVMAVTRQRDYTVTTWEGDTVILQSGEVNEQIIEAGGGEAWLVPDDGPSAIHALGTVEEFNRGIGSVYGGVYTNGVDEKWATDPAVNKLDVSFEQVNATTWKVTHTARNLADGWQVELRTWSSVFTGNTSLWPYQWGRNLPVFAAKGKLAEATKVRAPAIAGNLGPTYRHECGVWATGHLPETETKVVDAVLDFLSGQLTTPHPVITNLRVGYDPRRQLGDVITISSPDYMGVELRCLVVGVGNSASGSFTQSLAVRVIDVATTFTTWEQFERAWGTTANYTALETVWGAAATYSDFNNHPLKGASS